jgi:O-antigen ligase
MRGVFILVTKSRPSAWIFFIQKMTSSTNEFAEQSLFIRTASGSAVSVLLLCALISNFLFASGHDGQRSAEIVALGLVACVFLFRAAKGEFLAVPRVAGILLLAFFALGLASIVAAIDLRHAVFEWASLLLLLVLVFAIAVELGFHPSRWHALLFCAGAACGLYSLRVLIMYGAALMSGYPVNVFDLITGFSNPRFFNHTQTALVPLIILLYLRAPRPGVWSRVWLALASFWWALLFVTEARGSILALSIGCAAALTLRRSHARQFVKVMVGTALAGMVLYALLFILLPQMLGFAPLSLPSNVVARTVANPASDRSLLWTLAWQIISAHPWLGIGPQHFAHEGARLYAGAHPHNWLLQIAAEWGIPALLCLASVTMLGARALFLSGARIAVADLANQQMLVTLQVACIAILVDAMVSGMIVMPQCQLAIALVLGLACAWVTQLVVVRAPGELAPSMTGRLIVASVVAAGLCGMIWSVAPDFLHHARGDALSPAELAANPAQHWPRLWEAGYF